MFEQVLPKVLHKSYTSCHHDTDVDASHDSVREHVSRDRGSNASIESKFRKFMRVYIWIYMCVSVGGRMGNLRTWFFGDIR